MKVVISNSDHSVDVEVPDDMPDLDINEIMAIARDLYRETYKKPASSMGFGGSGEW